MERPTSRNSPAVSRYGSCQGSESGALRLSRKCRYQRSKQEVAGAGASKVEGAITNHKVLSYAESMVKLMKAKEKWIRSSEIRYTIRGFYPMPHAQTLQRKARRIFARHGGMLRTGKAIRLGIH